MIFAIWRNFAAPSDERCRRRGTKGALRLTQKPHDPSGILVWEQPFPAVDVA